MRKFITLGQKETYTRTHRIGEIDHLHIADLINFILSLVSKFKMTFPRNNEIVHLLGYLRIITESFIEFTMTFRHQLAVFRG